MKNENIDLTKILKDCPIGTKLYHVGYGDVWFRGIDLGFSYPIRLSLSKGAFNDTGVNSKGMINKFRNGECLLFPSKEQRDWSKFTAPWYKKGKFDPHTLQPFDKVLVRDFDSDTWICQLFSYIVKDEESPYQYLCGSDSYIQCVPYNDDTKYLVGTTNEAPEYYKYWEDQLF